MLKKEENGAMIVNSKSEDYPKHILKELEDNEYDYIKPSHYELFPGMEDTFEIHKAYLTKEEFVGWVKGTILKYKMRIGEKPGENFKRDLDKINVYRNVLKEYLNK